MSNWNTYEQPNLGLLFNRRLYIDLPIIIKYDIEKSSLSYDVNEKKSEFDVFFDHLTNIEYKNYKQMTLKKSANIFGFELMTTYPGLLLGSGYKHETGAQGDAKIGFYFDHTFGCPTIPGSSVKGVIKSVFENEADKTDLSSVLSTHFIINELINDPTTNDQDKKTWDVIKQNLSFPDQLDALKIEIFGTSEKEDIVKGDIFYDSYIDASYDGKILERDFITPHYENPLKNPKPLMFIKVIPNVPFTFRFKISASELIPELTQDLKLSFYKMIISTLGLGAKTNVGYGQFTDKLPENSDPGPVNNSSTYNINIPTEQEKESTKEEDQHKPKSDTTIPMSLRESLKKDTRWDGKIVGEESSKYIIQIEVGKINLLLSKAKDKCNGAGLSDKVNVIFQADCSDQPNFKVFKIQ